MPYNFDESKDKLRNEVVEEQHIRSIESEKMIDEKPVSLSFYSQFIKSFVLILLFYVLTFYILDMVNVFARIGLFLYLCYPSFSIIAEIIFTKKVRYRYYEGSFTIGNKRFLPEDIKKVAITEYSPYYLKNSYFKLPAFNAVGFKEFLVQLTPIKGRGESIFFFLCNEKSAVKFMEFLYKHKIQYGHVEKEYRKLFFYY